MCGVVLVVFLGDVAGIVPSGFLACDMYVSMHVSAAERSGIMYPATGGPGSPPPPRDAFHTRASCRWVCDAA